MKIKFLYMLVLLISVYAFVSAYGFGVDKMTCKGEIGNGYPKFTMEYRAFANKSVDFILDCGMYKRYLQGGKDCISYIDNSPISGYFSDHTWHIFDPLGSFDTKTRTLLFQLSKGYMQKGNVESLNQTQKWFNGQCKSY